MSKWTMRAVTRKGLCASSLCLHVAAAGLQGGDPGEGGGWRPLQSLCLWALASCTVRGGTGPELGQPSLFFSASAAHGFQLVDFWGSNSSCY